MRRTISWPHGLMMSIGNDSFALTFSLQITLCTALHIEYTTQGCQDLKIRGGGHCVIDFMGTFLGTLHATAEVNSDVIPIIL